MLAIALPAPAGSPGQVVTKPAPEAPSSLLAEGRQIAEVRCGGCHAVGAQGSSARSDAPAFRDLSDRYPVDQLQEALAEGIVVGHPDMPEVLLEPGEQEAFLTYLMSLQPSD